MDLPRERRAAPQAHPQNDERTVHSTFVVLTCRKQALVLSQSRTLLYTTTMSDVNPVNSGE